jgi:hypothetical protein
MCFQQFRYFDFDDLYLFIQIEKHRIFYGFFEGLDFHNMNKIQEPKIRFIYKKIIWLFSNGYAHIQTKTLYAGLCKKLSNIFYTIYTSFYDFLNYFFRPFPTTHLNLKKNFTIIFITKFFHILQKILLKVIWHLNFFLYFI